VSQCPLSDATIWLREYGRFVLPGGFLREAEERVWNTGSPVKYGRSGNPVLGKRSHGIEYVKMSIYLYDTIRYDTRCYFNVRSVYIWSSMKVELFIVLRLTCIRKYACALCISFHLIDGNFTQDIFHLMSFFYVPTDSVFSSFSYSFCYAYISFFSYSYSYS